MTTPMPPDFRRLRWLALDVIGVAVFVAIGRINHAHGLALAGYANALWPFLVGLAAGWLLTAAISAARERSWAPQQLWVGAFCVVTVVALGMPLRWLSGQDVAVAFVIVATVSNTVLLIGWRIAARVMARNKQS
ncbi:MAG: DUF3054 domain-containing protein [Gordonia sp. (in: high G+C Gram-positive bacteria)]|uniref:DUF3054 domain-containing protein n=1 Tax=Gordonia sp. (in: high G+C Gram-positive bacteria) TaxID=84139 RepID=UPI003BB4E217